MVLPMRWLAFIIPILLFMSLGMISFKPLSFSVEMEGSVPVVKWAAESEDGLHHYEVEVYTQFSTEPRVIEFEPRGAKLLYVFRDADLFKAAEVVEYAVYAVLNSGDRQLVGSEKVAYTPTAVRRTWGSIKAMFR